jgi:hypothetical protein
VPSLGLGPLVGGAEAQPGRHPRGLTATPRKLDTRRELPDEDRAISANNHAYFGEPVYEYSLIQAQEVPRRLRDRQAPRQR